MHEVFEFLKQLNVPTVLAVVISAWYFTRDIKKEIKSIHHELKFMNIRVSRLEGTTYGANIYAGLLPKDAKEEIKD